MTMMLTSQTSLLLHGGTVVFPEGEKKMDILIENGFIARIHESTSTVRINESPAATPFDASGLLILPGLIDCHVHFREPGLEQKETMATGAASALAGGVTTVCEMPNTIPPTVTVAELADKVRRADKLKIDMRFFFGATEMNHLDNLQKLFTDPSLASLRERCCGLKLYFDHSTGDQKAEGGVIDAAFKLCAELGIVAVCHCEDAAMNHELRSMNHAAGDIAAHSRMRPPESEEKAIQEALVIAKKYGTRLHVAHLSTKGGLELIRAAKKSGITVTCEVAPHHLFMNVDDYTSLGTLAKMNPPLRTAEHQEALWNGIADGTVDCISTDHAPHTLEEKNCDDPFKAPSGVPGVETMLPLLMTVAGDRWPKPTGKKKVSLLPTDIVRLCFTNPNRIFNLGKLGIVEGAPADLVLVDPTKKWTITGAELHSKCRWTPFEGWNMQGKVIKIVR